VARTPINGDGLLGTEGVRSFLKKLCNK